MENLEKIIIQGLKYEKIEKEKAAERKALTRKNGLKPEDAKYSQVTYEQTRDIVAGKLGISGKQWDRMKYIYLNRDYLSEDQLQKWNDGEISTSKLYNHISQEIRYNTTLDEMLEILESMVSDLFEYKKACIHNDIRHNLSYALYGSTSKTKEQVFENFDRLVKYNEDVLSKYLEEVYDMKERINMLKKKLRTKKCQ